MTDLEALEEARRRWGEDACVCVDSSTCFDLCVVGRTNAATGEPEWLGTGRTWEIAFAVAPEGEKRG